MLDNVNPKTFMIDGEYEFWVIRQEKYEWIQQDHRFIYFLYIVRKQQKVINSSGEVRTFNILCHLQIFVNYFNLFKTIKPVLQEYILEDDKIRRFLLDVAVITMGDLKEQIEVDINNYLEE